VKHVEGGETFYLLGNIETGESKKEFCASLRFQTEKSCCHSMPQKASKGHKKQQKATESHKKRQLETVGDRKSGVC